MVTRFGFGAITEHNEKSGSPVYENGHIDVSREAKDYAIEQYPYLSPQEAIGKVLAEDARAKAEQYREDAEAEDE